MERFKGNPILKPIPDHPWESRAVFNAAAVYSGGQVHIMYRGVGVDGISRIGYASSADGQHVDDRLSTPIFEPNSASERDGCEDPRLTRIGKKLYMCYTAVRGAPRLAPQVAITSIAVDDLNQKRWDWKDRILPFQGIRNKDAALHPRKVNGHYLLYHRIDPDICVAYSRDLNRWFDLMTIVEPRHDRWDCRKIGLAGPPIELSEGWLLIYHGVDHSLIYRLGVMLLEKDNPKRVLWRSEDPILEPIEDYERMGEVPNVVFSCGAVKIDERVLIYYGGADTVLCGASFELSELLP